MSNGFWATLAFLGWVSLVFAWSYRDKQMEEDGHPWIETWIFASGCLFVLSLSILIAGAISHVDNR